MLYYSAIKRKGIPMHAIVMMKVEDMELSEIDKVQEDKCCVLPVIRQK